MEDLLEHFNQWGGVVFFIIIYGMALCFIPFYKKMNRKPAVSYLAFVAAFAVEMHGIPFSMYLISSIIGRYLPVGILWGHTLSNYIGLWGLYLNVVFAVIGMVIIIYGWSAIYDGYWKKVEGTGNVIKTGAYKHIRHPQYTGLFLIATGMMLGWATLPTLLLYPVIIWMYVRLAKKEEADMLLEFGEEYREYMLTTKMFIPYIY